MATTADLRGCGGSRRIIRVDPPHLCKSAVDNFSLSPAPMWLKCDERYSAKKSNRANGIWICDECLSETIESVRSRKQLMGLILIRTYNETKRCEHADSETVLMAFDDEYDFQMENSYCERCLVDEQRRRMDWLRAQDSRDILLRQADALRDDPYLDELLAAIYRDRKQSEETN